VSNNKLFVFLVWTPSGLRCDQPGLRGARALGQDAGRGGGSWEDVRGSQIVRRPYGISRGPFRRFR